MKDEARKPDGGFVLVHGWALVAAWQAVRAALLRPVDLRVWLATFEAVARRCGAHPGCRPEYRLAELATLTGSAPRTVAESVARLRASGLVDFRRNEVIHGGTLVILRQPTTCSLGVATVLIVKRFQESSSKEFEFGAWR